MAPIVAVWMIPIPFTGMSVIWWLAIPALLLLVVIAVVLAIAFAAIFSQKPRA